MQRRKLRLPSPAIVIAMIALSLVLGGTAIAAGTSTPLSKKQVTKLVKKLAPKLSVKHSKSATNATNAVNATNATNATTAANATDLGGQPATYYAHAGHEAVHLIGATGEPPFQNSWANFSPGVWSGAGYWKDAFGVVHLTGTIDSGTADSVAFTLPAGYTPALDDFTVAGNAATATSLEILSNGNVIPTATGSVGLDSVTFLAGTQAATAGHHDSARNRSARNPSGG
jgi:hypothetical protein